jgi:hypothetical protein
MDREAPAECFFDALQRMYDLALVAIDENSGEIFGSEFRVALKANLLSRIRASLSDQ